MKFLSLLSILALLSSTASADPLVTSWRTDLSGRYARIFETAADEIALNAVTTWSRGQGTQAQPTYAGVSEVTTTATDVYVRASGLGAHIMGPWYLNAAKTNLFPNYPSNRAVIYRIPRDPGTVPTTKSPTGLGRIGLFVDGVSMFDSRDAFSYDTSANQDDNPMAGNGVNGDDVWNRDAFINEGVTFDAGNAHQAGAHHHYHANPPGLRHRLGDSVDYNPSTNTYTENFNGEHSPIIGWVRDGYPIYGPYGYSEANDADSAVTRMRSGYRTRSITVRQTLPAHAARDQGYTAAGSTAEHALPSTLYGPNVTAGVGSQFEIGHYLEDYEYLGDVGQSQGVDFDLDLHNGRFCVTPEYPAGTYAYFVSIEADGTPKFPYNIGRTYYGNPTANTAATIPAGAEVVFEGGPEKPLSNRQFEIDEASGDVTLSWSAVEGGTYVVERSGDLAQWEAIPAQLDGDELVSPDPAAVVEAPRRFYRSTLLDVAPFDDSGFDVDLDLGAGGNNVLLIIADDWGIDSSPIDNPGAARNASMPTLQWLSDNGLRFTNAYAQPVCSPTRATIMTGRYAFRHGVGSPMGASLAEDEFSLPEAFAAAGSPYALGSFGKWHLGGGPNGASTRGGWPEFAGILQGGVDDYYNWDKTINGVTNPVTDTYSTTDQVNDALAFISGQGDTPYFCWLAFNAPHTPFHEPPGELLPSTPTGNTNRDLYEKALEAMDTEIARLLAGVDLNNTNVLLIGDNGTPGQAVQAPFGAGHAKGDIYEGGVRVPFIAIGPDVRAMGTNDDLVHCADLFSTVLALAGIDAGDVLPGGTELDSRNLLGVLNGGSVSGCVVVETFGTGINNPGRAIREGDYKLLIFDDPAITTDTPGFEFYNVVEDLNEQTNLLVGGLDATEQAAYDNLLQKSEGFGGGFGDTGGGGGPGGGVSTGILSLSPNTGTAGSTITVTFNLDRNWTPNIPPLNNMMGNPINPNVMSIGTSSSTNRVRSNRYTASATFTLPTTPGTYDATIGFPGPNNPTFGLTMAFEVAP